MITRGSTSVIRLVKITDLNGDPKSDLAYDTSGLTVYYIYPGGTAAAITLETIATLGTYAAPTSNAHMRLKAIGSTMPGWYELQMHNDWFSIANARSQVCLCIKGADSLYMAQCDLAIQLVGFDLQSVNPYTRSTYPMLKNTAGAYIPFEMFATDGSRATGKTVTVSRSIDGAASWTSATGAVTEVADGAYWFVPSAADLNGSGVIFKFAATGCDPSFGFANPQA